nr:unnamed protein product [Callosobruchus chinensis]
MGSNERRANIINQIGPFIAGKHKWLDYFEDMERCFDQHYVQEEDRKDLCLASLGAKTVKLLKGIVKPQKIKDLDYRTIADKLEKHFYPNPNRRYYLTKFALRKQRGNETFFKYVSTLRQLLQLSGLDDKTANEKLRVHVAENSNCMVGRSFETELTKNNTPPTLSKLFCKGLEVDDQSSLDAFKHHRKKRKVKKCYRCNRPLVPNHENVPCPFDWSECESCEIRGHLVAACKYRNVKCNKCGVMGHVARICKGQKGLPEAPTDATAATVSEESQSASSPHDEGSDNKI